MIGQSALQEFLKIKSELYTSVPAKAGLYSSSVVGVRLLSSIPQRHHFSK